tara:strand:+ start:408 stop:560 length:153 start_codon:yes stop_codon:yes gene_type:complete
VLAQEILALFMLVFITYQNLLKLKFAATADRSFTNMQLKKISHLKKLESL